MANYLTPQEVAERLNVSKRHVHYLISKGLLRAHKFGPQTTRIAETDLNKFIENGKCDSETTA